MSLPPINPAGPSSRNQRKKARKKKAKGQLNDHSVEKVTTERKVTAGSVPLASKKNIRERGIAPSSIPPQMPDIKAGMSVTHSDFGPVYSETEHSMQLFKSDLGPGVDDLDQYQNELKTGSELSRSLLGGGSNGYVQMRVIDGKKMAVKRPYKFNMDTTYEGQFVKIIVAGELLIREAALLHWLGDCPDRNGGRQHILSPVGSGVLEGEPFIALPLMPKGSLSRKTGKKPLSDKEVINFSTHLFKALSFLHHNDVIHSDLKADNLLIDENDNLVLADPSEATGERSLAAFTYEGKFLPLENSGTPDIKPGGRVSFEPVGPHSDIWAGGLVVLEMLAGKKAKASFENKLQALPEFKKDFSELSQDERDRLSVKIRNEVKRVVQQHPMRSEQNTKLISALIQSCFEINAAARPSAEDVLKVLSSLGRESLLSG